MGNNSCTQFSRTTIEDVNVNNFKKIIIPNDLIKKYPIDDKICDFIQNSRATVKQIMQMKITYCCLVPYINIKIYAKMLKN